MCRSRVRGKRRVVDSFLKLSRAKAATHQFPVLLSVLRFPDRCNNPKLTSRGAEGAPQKALIGRAVDSETTKEKMVDFAKEESITLSNDNNDLLEQ